MSLFEVADCLGNIAKRMRLVDDGVTLPASMRCFSTTSFSLLAFATNVPSFWRRETRNLRKRAWRGRPEGATFQRTRVLPRVRGSDDARRRDPGSREQVEELAEIIAALLKVPALRWNEREGRVLVLRFVSAGPPARRGGGLARHAKARVTPQLCAGLAHRP